ncbi:Gfo/Idh/MocA family protein [Frigidibacter sp. ROC022]|uniref:Gfo/Idh/MocA family protein n=1 Tax=Frigidibacter sp. ROC022 TaxID=2971796 RepID=UPI00215A5D96|nr:Gfo/Idh/MocA family oxidoreductase [Frigidibacter sp. ROC022]MCR8723973.1 Gfo/Idh/MocA family oxidoreductase [Frigidibacter sp. ROC022]
MSLKLGILGIDHLHILGMLSSMQEQGCTCTQWWSEGEGPSHAKFKRKFGDLERVADRRTILDDPEVGMVLISAVPADRAALAIEAMEAGKDVMVDKPGCTTLEQLAAIKECQARTGRIWTVNFSERFEVPCVTRAAELVQAGAIGTVKQTLGLGPHRQNLQSRPDWFFQPERFGGILTDIGSHQIDQFLYFTGSEEVTISHARVENTTMPDHPGFQDFGEVVLTGDKGNGYVRIDWFTPDALPTWGDGRLVILGDKGYIELRKYTDIARQVEGNQLYLCNGERMERIDCNDAERPYFPALVADHHNRTETAVPQAHTYKAMELAIRAQMLANESFGNA